MVSTPLHSNIESLLAQAEDNALFRTRPDQYLHSATNAWLEAKRAKDLHSVARSKLAIGQHSLDVCAYQRALKLCSEARLTFEAVSDKDRYVEALDYEARAYMLMGRYDESMLAAQQGLASCDPRNAFGRGSLYHLLSLLSLRKGDHAASLLHGVEAVRSLRGSDERLLPFTLKHIASILLLHHRDSHVNDALAEAERRTRTEIDRYNENMRLEASHFDLQLIGDILSLSENYAEAQTYYKRAYNSLHHFQCQVTEAECLISLGRTSLKLFEENDAADYFAKALSLVSKLHDRYLIAKADIAYSDYLCFVERPNEAEVKLLHILDFTYKTNNAALQQITYDRLANLEERRNNFTTAVRYYQKSNDLLRSQITSLYRTTFTNASSSKIPSATEETTNEALQIRTKRVHELESDLKERDAILLTLRSKLREIVLMREEQRTQSIRALIATVAEHLNNAVHTQALRDELSELSSGFLNWLQAKHPLLTATERQVCSLLSLGFSNSEIERLLSLSPRTLECHRLHIRRKMKLKRNEKLDQTLRESAVRFQ